MQDLIKDTLGKLLTELQLEFSEITVDASDTSMIRVDIISVNPSRIIGWHGETLNALQHLVKSIASTKEKMEKAPFIIVDVDGYRRDKEQKVCGMAEQKIDFVRRKKTRVSLPCPPTSAAWCTSTLPATRIIRTSPRRASARANTGRLFFGLRKEEWMRVKSCSQ